MIDDVDRIKEYTPENLREIADDAEQFRINLLYSLEDSGADPISEQHYLAGLTYLELAVRNFKLAMYAQRRALAGGG